jgi:hypothetical protein
MDDNYNITFLVMVDTPIELSDLFDRARKAGLTGFKIEPPEIRIGPQTQMAITFTSGTPSFRFPKVVSGHDLLVFNVIHSDAKRGGFQLEMQNTKGYSISRELYKTLNEFVQNLGYLTVYAYEIAIRFIVNTQKYPAFKEIDYLQTMESPYHASLRLLDGYKGEKDLREEFISEIKIEELAQPGKSQVTTLHRFKDFDDDKIQKIFADLDKVLKLVR